MLSLLHSNSVINLVANTWSGIPQQVGVRRTFNVCPNPPRDILFSMRECSSTSPKAGSQERTLGVAEFTAGRRVNGILLETRLHWFPDYCNCLGSWSPGLHLYPGSILTQPHVTFSEPPRPSLSPRASDGSPSLRVAGCPGRLHALTSAALPSFWAYCTRCLPGCPQSEPQRWPFFKVSLAWQPHPNTAQSALSPPSPHLLLFPLSSHHLSLDY